MIKLIAYGLQALKSNINVAEIIIHILQSVPCHKFVVFLLKILNISSPLHNCWKIVQRVNHTEEVLLTSRFAFVLSKFMNS